ncbi:hypothetical protein N9E30_00475 [Flavobacteriales bacterium]|nr:hypothetical protein [Flavobacteriales bacterium]
MKAILLCLCFTVFSYVLYAQSTLIEGQSVIGEGLWSQNVCGISHTSNFAIGVSNKYAFGLEELSTSKLAAVAPLNIGVIGASWSNVGDDLYNENEIALSLARHFSSSFQLGIRMRLNAISINSESRSSFVTDIGMQSAISEKVSFGVQLENPFRAELQTTSLEAGLAYWLSKKASVFLSAKKESDLPTSVIVHINYTILEKVLVQGTLSNTAFFNRFGLAYKLKGLSLEGFLSHHSYLGFSPQVGISYSFEK